MRRPPRLLPTPIFEQDVRMQSPTAASARPKARRPALGAGIVAGVGTLVVGAFLLAQLGFGLGSADASAWFDVAAGECVNVGPESGQPEFVTVPCGQAHQAQIAGVVNHPKAGDDFPGSLVTSIWFEEQCATTVANFLGAEILATTLSSGVRSPTEPEWNSGAHRGVCYVLAPAGTNDLVDSIEGLAGEFERSDVVSINRLMSGDCFDPASSDDAFSLRSSDSVRLVDCQGSFSGLFFGRGRLRYPFGATMPPADELIDLSTSACAAEFESFFSVESAAGYTFRFWRPSEARWDGGDRAVLCAVLSDAGIDGPFQPAQYPLFHDLGTGQCFRLLPEQVPSSISLDDHVQPVRCSDSHVGQMIGSGRFGGDGSFPGEDESKTMTERECRNLFTAFVGVEPAQSSYGRFPYWYPNEGSWVDGDTRFACAFLGDQVLTESLQGIAG